MKTKFIPTRIIPTFIMIFLLLISVHSQTPGSDLFQDQSKFSLTFYLATTFGGPETNIENQMRASGFNKPTSGFFSSGTTKHPHSRYNGLPWMIEINYRFTPALSFNLQMSNSLLRETIGYANPQGGFGEYLFLNYSAKTYAFLISYYLTDFLTVGAGPAYNILVSFQDLHGQQTDTIEKNTLGLLAQLNLKLQLSRVFSLNLITQYRILGSATIGPFVRENTIGIATPNPTTVTITFPATEISYNHTFVGFGLGLHF